MVKEKYCYTDVKVTVGYALQNSFFLKKKKKNRNVNDKRTVQFQNSLIFNQAKLLKAPLAVLLS